MVDGGAWRQQRHHILPDSVLCNLPLNLSEIEMALSQIPNHSHSQSEAFWEPWTEPSV